MPLLTPEPVLIQGAELIVALAVGILSLVAWATMART